jgi:uncharacterized protein (TIGR04168 family)
MSAARGAAALGGCGNYPLAGKLGRGRSVRIGVVGDVHLLWDDRDVSLVDRAAYDLVLFVGDLAGYGADGALRVARSIAKLQTPALVIPGNHDAVTTLQLGSEVFYTSEAMRRVLAVGMSGRVASLRRALGSIPLCGYSAHRFESHAVTVIAARPHSIGGPRIAFARYIARTFGVKTMEDSAARLRALFDAVPSGDRIVVLAHCGPTGLGETRDAIYGNDFRPEQGDWGDPDLAHALQHARAAGKSVIAVVAGHMHHKLRGGGERAWLVESDGVKHVNAARVPRRRRSPRGEERHHVSLEVRGSEVAVEPVWLPVQP